MIDENKLHFSYCQLQEDGKMDNGASECDISIENGKIQSRKHSQRKSFKKLEQCYTTPRIGGDTVFDFHDHAYLYLGGVWTIEIPAQ